MICGEELDKEGQHILCAGWCQFQERQTGDCNVEEGACECSPLRLRTRHLRCINDEICSMTCQFYSKNTKGKCGGDHGWDCICESKDDLLIDDDDDDDVLRGFSDN